MTLRKSRRLYLIHTLFCPKPSIFSSYFKLRISP